MSIKDTKERQRIIHGLLQYIEYVASHERPVEELYHLEIILQQTLEKFINQDTWEEFYSELNRILESDNINSDK